MYAEPTKTIAHMWCRNSRVGFISLCSSKPENQRGHIYNSRTRRIQGNLLYSIISQLYIDSPLPQIVVNYERNSIYQVINSNTIESDPYAHSHLQASISNTGKGLMC